LADRALRPAVLPAFDADAFVFDRSGMIASLHGPFSAAFITNIAEFDLRHTGWVLGTHTGSNFTATNALLGCAVSELVRSASPHDDGHPGTWPEVHAIGIGRPRTSG
jgi:hypothetical protein